MSRKFVLMSPTHIRQDITCPVYNILITKVCFNMCLHVRRMILVPIRRGSLLSANDPRSPLANSGVPCWCKYLNSLISKWKRRWGVLPKATRPCSPKANSEIHFTLILSTTKSVVFIPISNCLAI